MHISGVYIVSSRTQLIYHTRAADSHIRNVVVVVFYLIWEIWYIFILRPESKRTCSCLFAIKCTNLEM